MGNKEYTRKWRKANPNYNKEYYARNREKLIKVTRQWAVEKRKIILKLLGDGCYLCNHIGINMVVHRKDGMPHNPSNMLEIIRNIDGYVLLCPFCHKVAHWVMEHFGFTWKQIIYYREVKND